MAFDLPSTSFPSTDMILKTGIRNVHFKNWSETFFCDPEIFFAPKTSDELKQILKLARENNKKVRVVGSGHSASDVACTPDYMISLQHLNKVLEVDKNQSTVKTQTGIIISELNDFLYEQNLALSVLGSISEVTIGGAIATGTHGTGISYGTLSTYVLEIELMLSNGTIMTLNREKNEGIFLAAACSLGSLGILLTVTLQCEPAFNLHLKQYGLPLQDVIENLSIHLEGSDHFRFMWFPYTDNVVVSHSSRTEAPANKDFWFRKILNWFWEYGIGYYTLEFCYYISTFFPYLVPSINRLYYNLVFLSSSNTKVNRSYRIFNFECLFKQHVNEWAIPIEKMEMVIWQLREWMESSPEVKVHFPIEVRFVKADNVFLSPAYGRDTCYINIIMYRPYGKNVPFQNYWAAYEQIMLEAGGRPHWAKAHSVTAEKFNTLYPLFGRWCSVRRQLDPIDMFLNPYMLRIFSTT